MRGARLLTLIFSLAFLLALPVPFVAQTPAESTLTNADIVKMMKAGVPEGIIVRAIQTSGVAFNTSADALIDLRKHGASEGILGAVLDSRNGTGVMATPLPQAQATASGPHHLPTFQADLKIKSNSLAKVSMTQNHIKVEQGGAPLFDLKWKEKPSH